MGFVRRGENASDRRVVWREVLWSEVGWVE